MPGGVAALFNILKMEQYYPNVSILILHNQLPTFLRIPLKYFQFIFKLYKTDIVHLNPSLTKKSFYRDAIFAWLTLLFSKKLVVYWHGWQNDFEEEIKNNRILMFVAKRTFLKSNMSIVLGRIFENKLRLLGYKNLIII